ncbi:ABC transporter ATP-binding protein [Sphaerochaeta sp. PS]|jgi:ABC-2 type transport system ATP-binding protein|uniref:ABC transporter ATP-binding protein n=1 Tax=Sphaerochaeta sp. PS TaxID=3076336 RepID=UPI0028A3BFBE|nr:ABC transporter ATP-binding protein [Sphaerochaeta sp. PS]MDT4761665.1 ABC transporter ATP-binding protein [Sphaerochaeta sp. PS]
MANELESTNSAIQVAVSVKDEVIHMQDIGFSYGRKPLFNHLNLSVMRGNIYGLLGKNGSGKTTLLKLLSGQLFPSEGYTSALGFDPVERKPPMLSEIFYLPEEFPLPKMKAKEYLAMRSVFYPRFDHTMFAQFCKDFSLDMQQNLSEMSLGQKKKLLLAFGLASNTALLILDEPTNGLDIPSKRQFRQTVASAMTEDRTFIISTHQVRDMENLIDPLIILNDGAIIFNDTVDSVNDRFVMALVSSDPGPEKGIVYKEKVLGGWMVLKEREEGEEVQGQPLDLETLFNVVVENPTLMAGGAR